MITNEDIDRWLAEAKERGQYTPPTYVSASDEFGEPGGGPPPSYQTALNASSSGYSPTPTGGAVNESRVASTMPVNYVPPSANTKGILQRGWQYPVDDPLTAVKNYLRASGQLGNPFNQPYQRALSRFSAGLLPQFIMTLLSRPGGEVDSIQEDFGNFIGSRLRGETGPLSYQQTARGLGDINSLLRQVEAASSSASGASSGLTPLQLAVAGMVGGDEASQLALMLSAYSPVMGQALLGGLNRALQPQVDAWQFLGPQNQHRKLLDLLLGSMED